ncbi:biopolymer transporter ExbD [Lysobacter sp. LF1]|uniref:Biopolymer transporter ExbD n=1 Tax=Lysobacter stagni TaxID=3045172 RepID=A0ABT6XD41_9GAMM|nr:biopolymer transporter ExbD [Lysobacter sp. LF1]MDI9238064.1 biopolymer transporter ExbD [Lysobacter sp. LF1]
MAVSAFHDSRRSSHTEMAQMNITPLVDVMLVLLVIFMLAAPAMTGQIDLRIPQPVDRPDRPEPPPRVALQVDASGQYTLDGVAMGRAELPQALRELAQNQPGTVLEIAANADADYQSFAWMLAEAQRSGVRDIAWK